MHDDPTGKDATVTSYEVYSPDETATPAPEDAHGERWRVAIEYSNNGQAKPPTIVGVSETYHLTRDEAMAAARKQAFEFDPPDPFSPQGRTVYRDGPDGFLVIIRGAMTVFHMSVRAVQFVGSA